MESGLRRPRSPLRWRPRCRVQSPPRPRRRGATSGYAIVLAIMGSFAMFSSSRAVAADPRAELEAVRQRIDIIADQYFKAQVRSREIAAEIDSLARKLTKANRSIRGTQDKAIQTAINLYRSQPRGFEVANADSTLDAARTAVFAQQSIARDNATMNAYVQAVAKLQDDNEQLIRRQTEARRNEARLKAEAAELDAALSDVQAKYTRLLEAEAAQRAAEADARNATTSSRPGSQSTTPNPTTPPTRGSGGTTQTTRPTTATTQPPPPPPPPGTNQHHNDPFLACVRQRESRGYYGAVNPSGYYGAYQFAIRTWNATASHAGRPQLIGVRPDRASAWDQDELAWVLYQWQGKGPWGGSCG